MTHWHEIYITDKTGRIGWKTHCTDWGLYSEKKNLQAHIAIAQKYPELYTAWDTPSMRLIAPEDNGIEFDWDDLDLLEALGV